METELGVLIYMDDFLIRSLSSMILEGYIEIRTCKVIRDKTVAGRFQATNKNSCSNDNKCQEDEKDGYKSFSNNQAENNQSGNENGGSLEDRENTRVEEEVKRIYTSFMLHGQLLSSLRSSNKIRRVSEQEILSGNLIPGEFVELEGEMSDCSIVDYLDNLISLLSCYGTDNLNKLLGSELPLLNYTTILKLATFLRDKLEVNGTKDMIVNSGNTPIVLNINSSYFMNNKGHMYDKVHCGCKMIGKVIRNCKKEDRFSLLRKTTQENYYEQLIQSWQPLLEKLSQNNILIPKLPKCYIQGSSVCILPISIFV